MKPLSGYLKCIEFNFCDSAATASVPTAPSSLQQPPFLFEDNALRFKNNDDDLFISLSSFVLFLIENMKSEDTTGKEDGRAKRM
jgi:hypothetical protein